MRPTEAHSNTKTLSILLVQAVTAIKPAATMRDPEPTSAHIDRETMDSDDPTDKEAAKR
jgi:hypothetical protein